MSSYQVWADSINRPFHQDMKNVPFTIDWYSDLLCLSYERYYRYERIRRSLLDPVNKKEEDHYSCALKQSNRYLRLVEYIRYRISMCFFELSIEPLKED